ncbi:MAG TPA: hypothetical protein VLF40_00755 [Candidatus Saccharimonadales bacterium]|nr:hypothetical protein [Candidatus Saccharimonadales bacterium]
MDARQRTALPWALSALVSVLAVVVWGQSFGWDLRAVNSLLFFPVLGLLAYSIMWSHYMVGAVKHTYLRGVQLESYFRYTGYVVLIAILLHPGILVFQLYRDGFGLPPGSYAAYVGHAREWIALLGTVSLFVFLAFEFHRWFGQKSWWKYVIAAGDVAMLAIFYHGLRLGTQLRSGWFVAVWWFYGITLVAALARKYIMLATNKPGIDQTTNW